MNRILTGRRAVSTADPDYLGRHAEDGAAFVEVRVFCDDDQVVPAGVGPASSSVARSSPAAWTWMESG